MIEPENKAITISRQCQLLALPRRSYYFVPAMESEDNLRLMRIIDEQFMKTPFFGVKQMTYWLRNIDEVVNFKRIRRLMRKMALIPIYPKPNLSRSNPDHKKYPYLLRNLKVEKANQVWCTDITYIPMKQGFMYLVAIMDWFSRCILSWRLSNTLTTDFCVEALQEAFSKYGKPEIFNTDQGSQFTSNEWLCYLKEKNIAISMDGKGRATDNAFIERVWRSLKYEDIYPNVYETVTDLKSGLTNWFEFYNHERPHSAFGGGTPYRAYAMDLWKNEAFSHKIHSGLTTSYSTLFFPNNLPEEAVENPLRVSNEPQQKLVIHNSNSTLFLP